MHFKGIISCVFVFCIIGLNAQSDSLVLSKKAASMIGISDVELVDFLLFDMPNSLESSAANNSMKYRSLKTFMMPPRNTDETGNAKCYAVTACAEYYANFNQNYKVNLSPDYIDLSLPENNLPEALAFLVKNGTVSADIVPYGSKFIPSTVRATQKYLAQNFLYLFRKENKSRQKIFALRKALLRGNPVIVEMNVPENFSKLTNQRVYIREKSLETKPVPFVVVGYDEEAKTVELLGTYGSNWANNGYLEIEYEDFGEMAETAFVIVPNLDKF